MSQLGQMISNQLVSQIALSYILASCVWKRTTRNFYLDLLRVLATNQGLLISRKMKPQKLKRLGGKCTHGNIVCPSSASN